MGFKGRTVNPSEESLLYKSRDHLTRKEIEECLETDKAVKLRDHEVVVAGGSGFWPRSAAAAACLSPGALANQDYRGFYRGI
jgi:hypothetical protein